MNIFRRVFELAQLGDSSETLSDDKDVKDFKQIETIKTTQLRDFD
jgi:hypothetical protein